MTSSSILFIAAGGIITLLELGLLAVWTHNEATQPPAAPDQAAANTSTLTDD